MRKGNHKDVQGKILSSIRNKMHGMLKKKKKDWCDKKGKVGWGDGFEQCSDIMDLTFLDC